MKTIGPATEAHERHMEAIKRIASTDDRREYIAAVRRNEGAFAAKWLADDFATWWQAQRQPSKGSRK
jgi:hypothetical protein